MSNAKFITIASSVTTGLLGGLPRRIVFATREIITGYTADTLSGLIAVTADMVDAQTALSIGLVNQVVPVEQLMDVCIEMAKKIASKGPKAIRLAKKVINEGVEEKLEKGSELETHEFGECFASGEAKEGMSAFLEKRKPNW